MKTIHRTALVVAGILALAAAAALPQVTTTEDGDKSVIYGSASLRSLAVLKKQAAALKVPALEFLKAEQLEKMFPFVGKGNVDEDRPIGLVLVGKKDIEEPQMMIFAIPVKDGTIPEAFFKDNNVEAFANAPDTFNLGGTVVRTMPRYFLLGGTPDSIAQFDAAAFVKYYKDAALLARINVDIKTLRKVVPDGQPPMLRKPMAAKPSNPGQEMFVNFFKDLFRKRLDRVTATLSVTEDKNYVLSLSAAPFEVKKRPSYVLPALPADSCFRLNLSHPEAEITQWCARIGEFAVGEMDDLKDLSADQRKQVQGFLTEVLTLLASGDAISVGLAGRNNTPVVYLVKRYKGQMNFTARVDKLVKDSASLATLIGEEKLLATRKYKIGGSTVVTRVELISDGHAGGIVDVVQRGNTVWLTFADNPGRHMSNLLSAKGKTTVEPGLSGYLDPPVLLEILSQDTSSPYHLMKADQRKAIAEKLGSKSVKWKTTFKDGTGRLDISVAAKTLAAAIEEGKRADDKPEKLDEAAARKAEIAILDKRIGQFKDWVPFYLKRARLRSRLGNHRGALADASKAASLCPRSRNALHRRAAERYFMREYKKAGGDLDRSISIKSDKAFFALTFSWHIARKAGDKRRLADVMKRIKSRLDADEKAGKKAWPRPMLSFIVGETEAEKLLELAAKSESADQATAEAHYVIGMKHLFDREKEKAAESLTACVELKEEDTIEYELAEHELKPIRPPTTQSDEK